MKNKLDQILVSIIIAVAAICLVLAFSIQIEHEPIKKQNDLVFLIPVDGISYSENEIYNSTDPNTIKNAVLQKYIFNAMHICKSAAPLKTKARIQIINGVAHCFIDGLQEKIIF